MTLCETSEQSIATYAVEIPPKRIIASNRGPAAAHPQGLTGARPQDAAAAHRHGHREGASGRSLTATRVSLRRVLVRRQLTPSKGDDARIDACTDLGTLERWLDLAITAVSVSDALG
jgi:hypothetical protein